MIKDHTWYINGSKIDGLLFDALYIQEIAGHLVDGKFVQTEETIILGQTQDDELPIVDTRLGYLVVHLDQNIRLYDKELNPISLTVDMLQYMTTYGGCALSWILNDNILGEVPLNGKILDLMKEEIGHKTIDGMQNILLPDGSELFFYCSQIYSEDLKSVFNLLPGNNIRSNFNIKYADGPFAVYVDHQTKVHNYKIEKKISNLVELMTPTPPTKSARTNI